MKEITLFEEIPVTRTGQKELGDIMKKSLADGEMNPIEAVVKAKSLYEVLSLFLKDDDVKGLVVNECSKYGKGETPSFSGAKVQVKETGVKWDYTDCGDPVYDSLALQMEELKQRMKQRESYLKTITERKTEIDEATGEIYTILPPVRTATTSYSITYNK